MTAVIEAELESLLEDLADAYLTWKYQKNDALAPACNSTTVDVPNYDFKVNIINILHLTTES